MVNDHILRNKNRRNIPLELFTRWLLKAYLAMHGNVFRNGPGVFLQADLLEIIFCIEFWQHRQK
jgi:hypothetical protein